MKKTLEIILVLVLLIAAVAKLITAGTENPALALPDNVITVLSVRQFMIAGSTLEIIVICILALQKNVVKNIMAVTLLAAGFSAYRMVLFLGHFPQPCGCIGYWYKALGLSTGQVEQYNFYLFVVYVSAVLLYIYRWMAEIGVFSKRQLVAQA